MTIFMTLQALCCRNKFSFWGANIYVSIWNFVLELAQAGCLTCNVFENCDIFYYFMVVFQKIVVFLFLRIKITKISKIRDCHAVDIDIIPVFFMCVVCSSSKKYSFAGLSNICNFLTKNRGRWRHKSSHNSKHLWQNVFILHTTSKIDVRERKLKLGNDILHRLGVIAKVHGGGGGWHPPSQWRVKLWWCGILPHGVAWPSYPMGWSMASPSCWLFANQTINK